MGKTALMSVVVGLVLAMVVSTGLASTVTMAADNMVANQEIDGSWPEAKYFVGECTIGLAHAYELTNDNAYKLAAERGGTYSLASAGGLALYPAEAYAMARLSEIQGDPTSNSWRTALVDNLDGVTVGTTLADWQTASLDATAVYDVARMAVAAHYADHSDKDAWRDGVVTLLADVDNSDDSSVMALGAAVWALATTGDISADTTEVWVGVEVRDLPAMLKDLQAPDNSFYASMNGTDPGWTETTVMGTLGLMAADASSPSYSYSSQITLAMGVLEGGVSNPGGEVYWGIGDPPSGAWYFAAGETLEVISQPAPIPEPATMCALGLAVAGLGGYIRRRRRPRT